MPGKEASAGPTIRDVARLAGVAQSTVSRVLNNRTDGMRIREETIVRVRRAAQTLSYQPNAAARSLRTTRTHTIGVIARDLLHPFTSELLRVFYSTCHARGYHLLVGHAEYDATEGRVLGDIMSSDRVDGVLLIGDCLPDSGKADTERLIQSHEHVVTVGARPSVAGELAILVDDTRAVTLALRHLVSLGHRSIGYLRGGSWASSIQWEDSHRHTAYRSFLSGADLPYSPAAELFLPIEIEALQEALRRFLDLPHRPTALLANDDMMAIIAIKAALTCGIRVPEDLSIVGIDDIPFAALCTPGLTTAHQPIAEMGRYAATYLLNRIGGLETALPEAETVDGQTVFFAPTLVTRESTANNRLAAPGAESV